MATIFTESMFIFVGSMIMSSFVVANAYYQKQQFYPSVVYITKSNVSMAIIYIQGLVMVLLLGKLIRKIFFGQLRTAEMEHLIERSWYAVTETCLAFTVFRDDLSPKFVALFTLLLFLKCFHWLAEDRVDYMERSPNISFLFHVRVISLLAILGILDATFVYMAYHSTLTKGASVQLVFGFEYAILFAIILNIAMKYVLHFFDLYNENPWEDKAIYLLYTELIMGFFKIGLYLVFIVIMMKIHTFPLFAIRPMYLTMRGFRKALNDVIMSRRAIRNMNSLYPNATAQDIENSDNVCIICRENMVGNGSCKKLPCNHIFHVTCLRSWFQRQQTCPTCRMDVLRASNTTQQQPQQQQQQQAQQPNANGPQPAVAPGVAVPGAANVNGPIPPPPFPQMFAHPELLQHFQQMFQHRVNQYQRQQQNQRTETNNNVNSTPPSTSGPNPARTTNGPTTNNTQNVPSVPTNIFPFLQSPPFLMPHLPAEALLSGFGEDELRLMEGSERQHLESRIKCLLEVKTLVNAALLRLQQYNNVMVNTTNYVSTSTQTDQILLQPRSNFSTYNYNFNTQNNSSLNGDQQFMASTSSSSMMNNNNNNNVGEQQDDDTEMIRQRRLQRFMSPSETFEIPDSASSSSSSTENNAQTNQNRK
ncbi:E3 ubiquitin-protein ligase synoviolin [Blomia tropicalis]|nr:E3 ubiquitin-protein ligase synoviolin [Blomia tropicalis]